MKDILRPDGNERVAEQLITLWRRWRQSSHPVRRGAVSWGQYMLLRRLWREGPMSVSALARAQGVQASTITITTKRLQELGYLQRQRGTEDERLVLVSLTEIAEQRLEQWQDSQMRALSQLVDRLGQDERATLEALLGRILEGEEGANG